MKVKLGFVGYFSTELLRWCGTSDVIHLKMSELCEIYSTRGRSRKTQVAAFPTRPLKAVLRSTDAGVEAKTQENRIPNENFIECYSKRVENSLNNTIGTHQQNQTQ